MDILFLIIGIILLDSFALLYGADSRDNVDSQEWLRRAHFWTRQFAAH